MTTTHSKVKGEEGEEGYEGNGVLESKKILGMEDHKEASMSTVSW